MFVYFAQSPLDRTTVKIGCAIDVEKRRRNMECSSPTDIEILASMEGGLQTEKYIQKKFKTLKKNREWYTLNSELSDFINQIKAGGRAGIPVFDENTLSKCQENKFSHMAIQEASRLVNEIIEMSFLGSNDTLEKTWERIEQEFGIPTSLLKRINYREKKDIWAGQLFLLISVEQQLRARQFNSIANSVSGLAIGQKEEEG